ncbi:MAG: glycosyltransferase family 2 protein [Oscillospiraceae bacterium]|nr:glycosyltransferase family 2 protein [Oscillospiraceae bacterium]
MEKISVIVPVYNTEDTLIKCVDSILKQTYDNIEIILIDDGSKDNSGNICNDISTMYSNVTVYHTANRGQSAARNLGILHATGEYIGFVDSDDYINQDMYENLHKAIKKYSADMSMCEYYTVKNGQCVHQKQEDENIKIYEIKEAIGLALRGNDYFPVYPWNKLFAKKIFDDIRFPEGRIYEDEYIIINLLERCRKIVKINQKEYYYVIREGSTVNEFSLRTLQLIEAGENSYKIVKERFQELYELGEFKLLWSYFVTYEKLLFSLKEYPETRKRLENLIKKNYKRIIKNKYISKQRKIAATLMMFHTNLYGVCLHINSILNMTD